MDVIQYKCPNCGGDLKYDPASGLYACDYCKSKISQDELDKQTNLKKEQAGISATPASSTNDDEKAEAKVYTCPSCGATIVTDGTTAATFCYYCHNPIVLSGRLEGDYQPNYVVPFKISKEQAIDIFEKWITKKKYVPKAFYSKDQIEKFTGIYFPYLLYTCNIDGNIDAQATKVTEYQEAGFMCTDTALYHVTREGKMEVKHVFRNALKKANAILADCVLPFAVEEEDIKPFNMSYLSGFFAEKRDLGKEDFDAEVKDEVMRYAIDQLHASAPDYRDLSITSNNTKLVNEKWEYALMPVWTLTYNDNGKIYYFSINGETGKTVGELPVDKGKLLRTFLIIFIPFALILLAVFYFLL